MAFTLVVIVTYSFLFLGIMMAWRTRSYQTALSLLVFSSISGSFLYLSGDLAGTLVYGSLLAFLPAYLFHMQYERPPLRSSGDESSVGDVILGGLLVVLIVFLFRKAGVGWCLSLVMGYWPLYVFIVIAYRGSRKAFYYAKAPIVFLSIGALIEELGLQKWLIPFVAVYLALFALWLKFDLLELIREPRIT